MVNVSTVNGNVTKLEKTFSKTLFSSIFLRAPSFYFSHKILDLIHFFQNQELNIKSTPQHLII